MKDKVLTTSKDFLKIQKLKDQGKKLDYVMVYSILLHIGHINHF